LSSPEPPRRGRPRDPEVERRIREAAISVYADVGWSGFNIERVAKEASVGKGSVYLRWTSASQLLLEAFETELRFVDENIDTGTLRGDLEALAHQIAHVYEGDHGRAYLRMRIEAHSIPGFDQYFEFQQAQMAASRKIVRRAVHRGELPADTRVTMLLDVLSGGLLVHSLTTPRLLVSAKSQRQYPSDLVDFILRAAEAGKSRAAG
jgi:AcrR family transcriptional regulator